uniref:Fibronectin type-III domain-containing protein n=1 Tax=Catharus ustulatus TaxID=91951 RepID=A0A8C3V345_CATUS
EQSSQGCQRPPWDSRFRLEPDQENYEKNEKVKLSCPEGFQPTYTEIKCQSGLQRYDDDDDVTPYSVYQPFWHGRDSRGSWVPIQSSVECIEVLQVDPQSFEISSTSIKLKWTCGFPDACQGMRAMCRLAAPSSPPCQAEEVKGEQMLHGQEGTVTCSPLQPFTEYSVTIDLPPNTTLFSWLFMTEQTVPDRPEKLWLDPDRGSLRWNSLPSCKGEIIGYQLNITARNAGDSSVLETERLRLNGSVTELRLPEHSPGSSYTVTIQGLTAAGAGAALLKEFHNSSSSGELCCGCPRSLGTHEPCSAACLAPGCPCSSASPAQAHRPGVPLQTPRGPGTSAASAPGQSCLLVAVLSWVSLVLCQQGCLRAKSGFKWLVSIMHPFTYPVPAGAQAVTPTLLHVLVSGQPLGPWPESAVIVVVVLLLLLILLSAGILWFVFCR